MECSQIDLYEFLTESELQHYYNAIKNELKISNAAQFKYATDEDLKHIGLSRPEIRRLRKFYERHFPHGYLSKIKRLLQTPTAIVKRDDGGSSMAHTPTHFVEAPSSANSANSPGKMPNNKHIIPADSITVNKQLGIGEFGIVQQGVWTNGTERIQVAIKCLCRERMQSNPMEFLKEAVIMHSIEHENIVRLYGVVLATDTLMLVTELAHLRSLLECLKDPGLRISFLTIPTLCEFAMQICNGMSYLENKRLIHRDLAARNILVFSKNKVKISDFGLSRALGVGKDYYKTNFNVNLKLPIAWCAPECINYLRFTNASDVWAYGVCLWEMFSYGFQPWAAHTGLEILEAIDAPNFQRLEQPDCCPREYYILMMRCWHDDPAKRPRFSEIYEVLPDMKPEQLKAVVNCCEPKNDHLLYRQGEIITVLDRNTGTPYWKGVLNSGKTGFFNPSNTVAHLEGLPSSNRDSFCRTSERSSKRKLRTEMISKPQNDFKHTGHVGIDGASFGDVAFLGNSQNYNHVPRQIVTPYKPSEDIEQTPLLLPPTPTSPDSLQTASAYFPEGSHTTLMNPSFVPSTENTPKHFQNSEQPSFEFPGHEAAAHASTNPFAIKHEDDEALQRAAFALQNNNYGLTNTHGAAAASGNNCALQQSFADAAAWRSPFRNNAEDPHEYHEISDDEISTDKLDFGPSLLDEINSMFGSISAGDSGQPKTVADFEQQANVKNEFTEITSKLVHKSSAGGDSNGNKFGLSSKKKTAGTVKPISVKDEKILNHAIEIANEISARSMNDLVADHPSASAQSPKRKFSFRFPHLTNNGGVHDKHGSSANGGSASGAASAATSAQQKSSSPYTKKKNFTEELKSIPDLQAIIGEEGREAYNSLIERKNSLGGNVASLSLAANLLRHLDTNEFDMTTAKTLPRRSLHVRHEPDHHHHHHTMMAGAQGAANGANGHQLAIPLQNAPIPMTLPTRGAAAGRARFAEYKQSSGRHSLGDKFAGGKGGAHESDENCGSPCESPSYLSNTFYKFPPETTQAPLAAAAADDNTNPIPLPSREGKKHIKTNPKRHVRKYPLIIPANGVQRTLNKVTEMTPAGDSDDAKSPTGGRMGGSSIHAASERITYEVVASIRPNPSNKVAASGTAAVGLGLGSGTQKHMTPSAHDDDGHTYQNIEHNNNNNSNKNIDTCTDSASLQFESILEADFNKGNVLQSPDVTDGFYNFSIQKEHYTKSKAVDFDRKKMSGLYVNEDELRNLDIERKMKISSHSSANADNIGCGREATTPAEDHASDAAAAAPTKSNAATRDAAAASSDGNELAGNALFRKVRETVEMAMDVVSQGLGDPMEQRNSGPEQQHAEASSGSGRREQHRAVPAAQTEAEYFAATAARLANSNSVSCEDLLEFSDKKPKGCERGVDSDEVRIMMKVLGKDSTPTRCLQVLEFIDWDVHKAIKIIKLQNILPGAELSAAQSTEALLKYEWDLQSAALKLRVPPK